MLSKEECQGGMHYPPLIDGRLHVDDVDSLFGSRVRVQKRDCIYSIVHTSVWFAHSILATLRTSPPF